VLPFFNSSASSNNQMRRPSAHDGVFPCAMALVVFLIQIKSPCVTMLPHQESLSVFAERPVKRSQQFNAEFTPSFARRRNTQSIIRCLGQSWFFSSLLIHQLFLRDYKDEVLRQTGWTIERYCCPEPWGNVKNVGGVINHADQCAKQVQRSQSFWIPALMQQCKYALDVPQ